MNHMDFKNSKFCNLLDNHIKFAQLDILVEQICNYLESTTIEESFVSEYNRKKDIDWYHTSMTLTKNELKKIVERIKNGLAKRGILRNNDNPVSMLKKLFISATNIKLTRVKTAFVDIERGGNLVKIHVGIGIDHSDHDWSEGLDSIFGFLTNNKFQKEPAEDPTTVNA